METLQEGLEERINPEFMVELPKRTTPKTISKLFFLLTLYNEEKLLYDDIQKKINENFIKAHKYNPLFFMSDSSNHLVSCCKDKREIKVVDYDVRRNTEVYEITEKGKKYVLDHRDLAQGVFGSVAKKIK